MKYLLDFNNFLVLFAGKCFNLKMEIHGPEWQGNNELD